MVPDHCQPMTSRCRTPGKFGDDGVLTHAALAHQQHVPGLAAVQRASHGVKEPFNARLAIKRRSPIETAGADAMGQVFGGAKFGRQRKWTAIGPVKRWRWPGLRRN
jgi:hypothetical protein